MHGHLAELCKETPTPRARRYAARAPLHLCLLCALCAVGCGTAERTELLLKDREIEELRRETIRKQESLTAAQEANGSLRRELQSMESERARILADLARIETGHRYQKERIDLLEGIRRSLEDKIDEARRERAAEERTRDRVIKVLQSTSQDLGNLRLALPHPASESGTLHVEPEAGAGLHPASLIAELQNRLQGARALLQRGPTEHTAAPEDGGIQVVTADPLAVVASDASSAPPAPPMDLPNEGRGNPVPPASMSRLPVASSEQGFWQQVLHLTREHSARLLRTDRSWSASDLSFLGTVLGLTALLIWLLGWPLRIVLRGKHDDELKLLRRIVRDMDGAGSMPAQTSALPAAYRPLRDDAQQPAGPAVGQGPDVEEGQEEEEHDEASAAREVESALERALPALAADAAGGTALSAPAPSGEAEARDAVRVRDGATTRRGSEDSAGAEDPCSSNAGSSTSSTEPAATQVISQSPEGPSGTQKMPRPLSELFTPTCEIREPASVDFTDTQPMPEGLAVVGSPPARTVPERPAAVRDMAASREEPSCTRPIPETMQEDFTQTQPMPDAVKPTPAPIPPGHGTERAPRLEATPPESARAPSQGPAKEVAPAEAEPGLTHVISGAPLGEFAGTQVISEASGIEPRSTQIVPDTALGEFAVTQRIRGTARGATRGPSDHTEAIPEAAVPPRSTAPAATPSRPPIPRPGPTLNAAPPTRVLRAAGEVAEEAQENDLLAELEQLMGRRLR